MNKKKIKRILIMIILILILIRVINIIAIYIESSKVSEIDINKEILMHREAQGVSEFPLLKKLGDERVVGNIETPKEAKKQAELIFIEIFGRKEAKGNKPYEVWYDKEAKVWCVIGHKYPNWLKGEFIGIFLSEEIGILITQEEGKILGVWAGK